MDKDPICEACPIGKHCAATNALHEKELLDRGEIEKEALDIIHSRLITSGANEGKDFIFRDTSFTLLNYNGQNLWRNTEAPTPESVPFKSMLVKLGALKKIKLPR